MKCGVLNAECGVWYVAPRRNHLAERGATLTPRRGLAPLELVLALPLLMMVMALMIIFGNAAYWKVRGLTVTRNAAWSNRWPRTGFDEPTPKPWNPRQYSHRDAPNIQALDDPSLKKPVVRGPLPNGFKVDDKLLNPARGMTEGYAQAKLEPAMMPKLKQIQYKLDHPLLDDKFQYPQMGIPANVFRRIPFIYELPKTDESLSQAWAAAAQAVMNAPFKADLQPLDHDEEIFSYYGYYPDFHPHLRRFCHLKVQTARDKEVRDVVARIKRLPRTMASFWLRMYQSQINGLDPATSAGQIGQLQAQVDVLQAFLDRLKTSSKTTDASSEPQLLPIPIALVEAIGSSPKACCGAESPLEQLLRLMDLDESLE